MMGEMKERGSERAIEICETYTPGKNLGKTRSVTIDRIPALELRLGDEVEIGVTTRVFERCDVLLKRALRSNRLQHQRIIYTETGRLKRPPTQPVGAEASGT